MSAQTTGLITVGDAMIFRPTTDDSIVSVQVTSQEDFEVALTGREDSSKLELLHIIIQSKDVTRLYNPAAVIRLTQDTLKSGGELTVHLLSNNSNSNLEMAATAVSPEAIVEVRSSLVLAGLQLQVEAEGEGGAWILTAKKPDSEQ